MHPRTEFCLSFVLSGIATALTWLVWFQTKDHFDLLIVHIALIILWISIGMRWRSKAWMYGPFAYGAVALIIFLLQLKVFGEPGYKEHLVMYVPQPIVMIVGMFYI